MKDWKGKLGRFGLGLFASLVSAAGFAASTGSLLIDPVVESREALPAETRFYIAVVRHDAPWRQPAREVIATQGAFPVRWKLSAGRYRLVVGAPGLRTSYGDPIEIRAGEPVRSSPSLDPFTWLDGSVVDSEGDPIAGARVGHLRAWLETFARKLSPAAESLLGPNFATVTDGEGRFRLAMLPEVGHAVWVEAPGYAPRFFPDLRTPRDDERLAALTLERGASLSVSWTDADLRRDETARIELRPLPGDLEPVEGIDRRGLAAIWERSAASKELVWNAVPAGRYAIVRRGPRWGAHSTTPRAIGSVTLSVGESGQASLDSRGVAVPVDTSVAEGEAEGHLVLVTEPETSRLFEERGFSVFRWHRDRGREAVAVREVMTTSSGGLRIETAATCKPGTRFSIVAEGRAGASAWLQPPCVRPIQVLTTPVLGVTGRLELPDGRARPPMGELAAHGCGRAPTSPGDSASHSLARSIPFAIGTDGRFAARAPSGCSGVLVRVDDLAVASLPLEDMAAGAEQDVGTITLRPGGSALLRIVSAADGLPLVGARISTLPATTGVIRPRPPGQAGRLVREPSAIADEEGWVRLFGLPPGDHVFFVQRNEVRLPHLSEPYRLLVRDELVVDPLAIPDPARLEVDVVLSPSLAEREVDEVVVIATQRDPVAASFRLEEVAVADRAVFDAIALGAWRLEAWVRLRADQGKWVVGDGEVEVFAGANRAVLEIEEAFFEGRVTYRGEGVVGRADFRPAAIGRLRHRKIGVRLGRNGRFIVALEPGSYDVEVWDDERELRGAQADGVELIDPGERIEIELPSASMAGVVVDEDGRPVEGARVAAHMLEAQEAGAPAPLDRRALARRDGFRFHALKEGTWTVWAEDGDQRSDYADISLGAEEAKEDVLLTLEARQPVALTILDHQGAPVLDARGSVTFRPTAGTYGSSSSFVMGRDGRYLVEITDEPGSLANLVLRGPHVLDAQVVPVADGEVVRIAQAGAHVSIVFPAERWERLYGGFLFLARADGAFVDLVAQARTSKIDEQGRRTLEIASLGTGAWRVVGATSAEELALVNHGRALALPALATLESWPGGVVEVEIPSP